MDKIISHSSYNYYLYINESKITAQVNRCYNIMYSDREYKLGRSELPSILYPDRS